MKQRSLLDAELTQKLERFGEDACDLLQAIQESLGIEFTTDEMIAAETIGHLSERISNKLTDPRAERCLKAVVFYKLRRAFIDLFRFSRVTIRPDTWLSERLPWINR